MALIQKFKDKVLTFDEIPRDIVYHKRYQKRPYILDVARLLNERYVGLWFEDGSSDLWHMKMTGTGMRWELVAKLERPKRSYVYKEPRR